MSGLLFTFGCTAFEARQIDLCAMTPKPGASTVAVVRPAKSALGSPNLAYPWVAQVTLIAKRSDVAVLSCIRTAAEKCVEVKLLYPCTVESETPSTSTLMNALSSPAETIWNKMTITPAVP